VRAVFGPASRYRTVPGVAAPDPQGRVLVGTDVRPLPAVTATFRHVVGQTDRLDEVATRYYQRPLLWWQICDANPDVLSPLDLLAAGPVHVTAIPLTLPDGAAGPPPWSALIQALLAVTGVSGVRVLDEVSLVSTPRTVAGRQVAILLEQPVRAVEVTHSAATAPAADLLPAVRSAGFTPGRPDELDQAGQEILIPPLTVR